MIKFSGEAVTDNGTKKLGFIGENEEVMRSPSLNCNIPSPEILKRFYAKILFESLGPRHDPMLAHEMENAKILSLPIADKKKE